MSILHELVRGLCSTISAAWVLILQGHGYLFGFWVFVKVKTESSLMESGIQFEVIAVHGTAWAIW